MKLAAIAITLLALRASALYADEESTRPALTPAPSGTSKPVAAAALPEAGSVAIDNPQDKSSRRSNVAPSPLLAPKDHRFHPEQVRELLDRWLAEGFVRPHDASNGEPTPDLSLTLNDASWGGGDRASAALLELSELRIPSVSVTFSVSRRPDGKTPQPAAALSIGPRVEWEAARSIVEVFARHGISTKVERRPTIALWFVSSSISSPDNAELQSLVDEMGLKVHKEHPLQLRTEVLFPENAAAIYEPQRAAQLLKWLQVRKLVFEEVPGDEQLPWRVTRSPVGVEQNNGLVKRTSTWSWQASTHISPALQPGIEIQRALTVTEDWRGKAGPGDPAIAYTSFSVPVEPGTVAIVHAFPIFDGQNDQMFAAVPAAHRKENYIALLIIQNHKVEQAARELPTDSDEPKLMVPDAGVPVRLFPGPQFGNAFAADFQVPSRLIDVQSRVFELHNLSRPSKPDSSSADDSQKFSLRFSNAPWPDVLELLSEKAGLTLDLRSTPPGSVELEDSSLYSPTEAIDRLNEQLFGKGYILIPRERTLICLNFEKEPVTPDLVPSVAFDDLPSRGRYELLSVTIPVSDGNKKQVAQDLDLLKGPAGSVVPLTSESAIVVTDLGVNLRQMARTVPAVSAASNKRWLEVYQLKAADYERVAKSLNAIMPGVVVNQDGDAKRIHVMGTAKQHEQVRQHIAPLESSRPAAQGTTVASLSSMPPADRQFKVFKLQNARAGAMAGLLAQVIRTDGFVAAADERTNSVLVTSPDGDTAILVEAILTKLDSENPARDAANPMQRRASPGEEPGQKPIVDLQQAYAAKEAAAGAVAAELRARREASGGEGESVVRYSSQEFFNQAGRDEKTFVDELHKATLGRPARDEERAYWVDRFKAHGGDRLRFVREFLAAIQPGKPAAGTGVVDPQESALREKLAAAVKESFAARQAMLAAELAALEARINETRQALELRGRIADQIVARRVEDLMSFDSPADEAGRLLSARTAEPFAPAVGGGDRRTSTTTQPGRTPRTLDADGLDFGRAQRLVKSLGSRSNAQTTGSGVEFQFEATDAEYEKFRAVVEAEAAEAHREKEDRDQAKRLALLTGIWDQVDSGSGVGPNSARLVISDGLAATFEGTQRKRLLRITSDAEGSYDFTALDGQTGMQGSYNASFGAGSLRLVSVGQGGAKIVSYSRTIEVVPQEWIAEMQKAAGEPQADLRRVDLSTAAREVGDWTRVPRPTPQDVTPQLTGIWEELPAMGMMGMEGIDPPDVMAGFGPAMSAQLGEASGAAGRLIISGDLAALYEKNERKRLWKIVIEDSDGTLSRINFLAQDGQAGMQGAYVDKDRSLTVVSTGDDGARIVRYHRTVSAVPPEWAKQMQAAVPAAAGPPAPLTQPTPRPALSPEEELLSNLAGLWTSSVPMGGFGGMGGGGYGEAGFDAFAEGRPASTFLVIHAGQAAVYEKNERKRAWSIAIEDLGGTQARLNFIPAKGETGMQGSYTHNRGDLTVVSAGEEGPKIEHYRRAVPIVPPEWANALAESAFETPVSKAQGSNRNQELLRGITSGRLRPAARPFGADDSIPEEFRSRGQPPGTERKPSDYLELVRPYADLLAERERLRQTLGDSHVETRARAAEFERAEKAIALLKKEFEAELHDAVSEIDRKRAIMEGRKSFLERWKSSATDDRTSQERLRRAEKMLKDAEAELEAAETRKKLLDATQETLFPPASPAPSALTPSPAPEAPPYNPPPTGKS